MAFHFPPELEAKDEAFWQEQENRKRGFLGQPCCTQSKTSWALMDVPGELAVVVHGEHDCLNCFHHHLGSNAHNFFSSRLTDHQITTGTTQQPLEHLLRLIIEQREPDAIVVLGTCPVEVIGDRFEVVTDKVSAELGTPIVAMHTSGLKMTSLTDCQDWLFDNLASLPQIDPIDATWVARAHDLAMDVALTDREVSGRRSQQLAERFGAMADPTPAPLAGRVNFLGLPEPAREVVEVLGALGLTVNGFYPHGATLDHWRTVRHAARTVAIDAGKFPKLTKRLTEAYQQEIVDSGLPIGLDATLDFYRDVAGAYGVADRLDRVVAERVAAAQSKVDRFRQTHGGVRLAMAIRMLNTYQVDRLVQDGMGDVRHLRELGFDVTLLVQGPLEEGPRFEASLRARGVDLPVRTFPGPFRLGEYLADGGYEVCHVPDSSRNTARRAGLPMISSRALRPWLSGIDHNLEVLADLVDEGRRMRAAR